MANLTLSVDDELLNRGRRYAKARGTSLNSLVRKLLVDAVASPDSSVETMIARLRQSAGDSKGVPPRGRNSTAIELWRPAVFSTRTS